jgi:hypothetical protein
MSRGDGAGEVAGAVYIAVRVGETAGAGCAVGDFQCGCGDCCKFTDISRRRSPTNVTFRSNLHDPSSLAALVSTVQPAAAGKYCLQGRDWGFPGNASSPRASDGRLVAGDIMLAQKFALETNELGVLAVANTLAA